MPSIPHRLPRANLVALTLALVAGVGELLALQACRLRERFSRPAA